MLTRRKLIARAVMAEMVLIGIIGCTMQAGKGAGNALAGEGPLTHKAISSYCAQAPFEMTAPGLPQIPDRSVSLADFGGVGDGVTLNTDAFAKAIAYLTGQDAAQACTSRTVIQSDTQECVDKATGQDAAQKQNRSENYKENLEAGQNGSAGTQGNVQGSDKVTGTGHKEDGRMQGGWVEVPAGIWLTGPITLQSHIGLRLDENAIVVFDPDQDLYPIIDTNFEGLDVRRCLSPLNATGATDIAITGKGIFDGSGDAWREVKKRKVGDDQWKRLLKKGGIVSGDGSVWFPDEGYAKARATAGSLNYPDPSLDEQEIKTFLRPVLLSFRECERILIEGCTFQNSPCWNLHPLWCKDLIIRDITVRNPHYSANGDGIDIDACEDVILTGSSFDVGDDAICIKSGKDADGRRHARKCRNLIITDCTVYHGHGGFVVGSEMSGGVENILVSGCRFIGTDVGLRFKSTRGRGGLVKDIWCDHIYMKDIVTYGVIFNLYYAGVAATEMSGEATEDILPVDETTPEFRDCHFSDILCTGADQAIFINGLPELPIRGLTFRDSRFTANKGAESHFAEDITYENVLVNGETL